ncbi:MAG TPA: radical SAM protein [bacterium]|nr:radical SAM protein [bacterium]
MKTSSTLKQVNLEEALSGFFEMFKKEKEAVEVRFKNYAPRGGHPNWNDIERRADELVAKASEVIEFDDNTIAERVRETERVSKALATTAVSASKNYTRFKNGNHAVLPPYFIWTMHNTCNFRCSYCDNHRGEKYFDLSSKGALDTEKGKKLLEVCRKNVTGVYFCGGEPTLRKDLPELVEYAHSINYFPLMINTNGSRIHEMLLDKRYSKWLKRMDIIIVSLDALNVGLLSETWGVSKELCEQVMVNILALRKLQSKVRFKLMVNTVITPETISEADSILDWTSDLGIWYSPVPMNCGATVNNALMSDPAYKALADKIIQRKKDGEKILGSKRLIRRLMTGDEIQCYPTLKPHVDPDGSLLWPCKAVEAFEPHKINLLNYSSLDEAYHAASKIVSVDNFHGCGEGQCGADCNWMQNYVSDVYARGIQNPVSSGVINEIVEFVGSV